MIKEIHHEKYGRMYFSTAERRIGLDYCHLLTTIKMRCIVIEYNLGVN